MCIFVLYKVANIVLSTADVLISQVPFYSPLASAGNTSIDWNFTTTAQSGLNGRSIAYARGFGLGGSSAISRFSLKLIDEHSTNLPVKTICYTRAVLTRITTDMPGLPVTTGGAGTSWNRIFSRSVQSYAWSVS